MTNLVSIGEIKHAVAKYSKQVMEAVIKKTKRGGGLMTYVNCPKYYCDHYKKLKFIIRRLKKSKSHKTGIQKSGGGS